MTSRAAVAACSLLGLAVLLGIVFLGSRPAREGAVRARSEAPEPERMTHADLAATAADERRATPGAAAGAAVEAAAPEETPAAPAVEPAPEPEEADLRRKDTLDLRVVDARGVGVAEAEVRLRGMRSSASPGSWYPYRGEEPSGKTDTDGRLRLEHWTFVDQDGRTTDVDLFISHPEYAPFRESSFKIGPGEHEVVLHRGSTLVVSAWLGTAEKRVAPITVQLDRDSLLASDAWRVNADGSLETTQILPGSHLLRVEHHSAEHGACFSAIEPFELAEGDWKALDVELFPGERLAGELDAAVPRPVRSAHVQLCIRGGSDNQGPKLSREYEAEVDAQGRFIFEDLPRGSAQLFALASGWSARNTPADTLEEAGIEAQEPPEDLSADLRAKLQESLDARMRGTLMAQRCRVPSELPVIVLMEPTATIEARVLTASGAPLEGAVVNLSPNICYDGVGCSIVPWREWQSTTDASGRTLIADVPPDEHVWISAYRAGYQMRQADRIEMISSPALSGQVNLVEIVLEPVE